MFHRAFGLLSGYTRGSRWRNAGCGVLSDGLCPASLSNEGEFAIDLSCDHLWIMP